MQDSTPRHGKRTADTQADHFRQASRRLPLIGASVTLSLLAGGGAQAQDTGEIVTLETVTVTAGTRTERSLERSPGTVEVITREDIQRSGSVLLADILRNHSALFVSADGLSLSIRGAAREDTVFLINGRRVLGEPSRRYELNRLTAGQIERIEIVKGPGSVLYGSDAMGGVINIITHQPGEGFGGSVDVQAGVRDGGGAERYTAAANLYGGDALTQFSLFANATTRNAYEVGTTADVRVTGNRVPPSTHGNANSPLRNIQDQYRFDEQRLDEADVYNLGVILNRRLTDTLEAELELGRMEENRTRDYVNTGRTNTNYTNNANGQIFPAFNVPTRWTDDNQRTDLAAALNWQPDGHFNVNYRIHHSRYEKSRSVTALPWEDLGFAGRGDSNTAERNTTTKVLTNELLGTWRPDDRHTLLAGAEYRDMDGRWDGGLFAQHEWQATERLDLVYGLRYDEASVGEDNTSAKVGGVLALTGDTRLRFNYAQGFKVAESRSYDVIQVNPNGTLMLGAHVENADVGKTRHDLKPERSETFEIGLLGRLGPGRYTLTAFHTDFRDRVERVTEQPADVQYITFRNVGEARIKGIEASLSMPLGQQLDLALSATWLDAENRDTGLTLSGTPENVAVAGLNWTPNDAQMWQLRVRHVGERYLDAANTDKDEAYTVADLNASFHPASWRKLELYGGIDNLFDRRNDTSLFSDPGRYYRIGLRYFL